MGLLGSLGALGPILGGGSGDWWSQFQPHPDQSSFAPPTGGITGQPNVDPSQLKPAEWTDPNRRDYQPNNPIWPAQSTDPSVPGYIDPNKPIPIDGGFNMGGGGMAGDGSFQDWFRKMVPGGGITGGMDKSGGYTYAPGNSAFGQAGGNGGMLGALGRFPGLQQALTHMRTPSGRILGIPRQHIQEALARGATHLEGF